MIRVTSYSKGQEQKQGDWFSLVTVPGQRMLKVRPRAVAVGMEEGKRLKKFLGDKWENQGVAGVPVN